MKMSYLKDVVTLRLDAERCVGCGRCVEVCPHGVFVIDKDRSRIADRDACMECGACARNCPVNALRVRNGVGCAVGILNSALGRKTACCGEEQACCCDGEQGQEIEEDKGDKRVNENHKSESNGQRQETGACGPECCCGAPGVGSRTKWLICGGVALAAAATIAAHVAHTRATAGQAGPKEYAAALPPVTPETPTTATQPTATQPTGWGSALKSLAELNEVAARTEAVFVVLPATNAARTASVQKEVETAVATITGRGTSMGMFLLNQDSQEYAGLAQKVGVPAVLALTKGKGMALVADKEISQEGLLKAFVGSSRPSGCGPAGCAPGASCN